MPKWLVFLTRDPRPFWFLMGAVQAMGLTILILDGFGPAIAFLGVGGALYFLRGEK